MAKRRGALPSATVIQLPRGRSLDVPSALLKNQSTPTVLIPAHLQVLVDRRARELAEEAYQLCRQHLLRRVAFCSEYDQPRKLDVERAIEVLHEGGLGDALVRVWQVEMEHIAKYAESAAFASARFVEEMRTAMDGFQVNPRS